MAKRLSFLGLLQSVQKMLVFLKQSSSLCLALSVKYIRSLGTVLSVEDVVVNWWSAAQKIYTFTSNGYFFGNAYASNYSVDQNGGVNNPHTASIKAEIFDANGKPRCIIADVSAYQSVTSNKVFFEIKKGWYIEITDNTSGGNRGYARVTGTAIYIEQ